MDWIGRLFPICSLPAIGRLAPIGYDWICAARVPVNASLPPIEETSSSGFVPPREQDDRAKDARQKDE